MKVQKIKELEEMARNFVGDGKSPNLFFVSDNGVIITITRDFQRAYNEWSQLSRRSPRSESALEDRKFGTVCQIVPNEMNKKEFLVFDESI